ncbi:MAG: cytotoxic translational repressor of toxin-antitoxin stability system [Solirubrobacterales bacterium]|jgi:hypothetical protein|nr:cytotoxic translational repressor of toxin-antitoxin stability system [Solirubrobacterales bacterium]
MTPTSPTWGDIRDFLAADKWRELPSGERGGSQTDHVWFEKVLDDGRVLRAKVSHAKQKTVSAGRFRAIARHERHELEVSVPEFWECIRSGQPVARPVEVEEVAYQHPTWAVNVLAGQMHMSGEDIAKLSREQAEQLVREHWQQG